MESGSPHTSQRRASVETSRRTLSQIMESRRSMGANGVSARSVNPAGISARSVGVDSNASGDGPAAGGGKGMVRCARR